MTIDATIQRLTGDGEIIAQFLVDTLQGNTRDATVGHRIKSAEWLAMFGRLIPESAIPKYASVRPRPNSEPKPDKTAKTDKLDKKPKVTEKQILHFDIARLIKQETNDGETIIEFLIRVISKIEETGENFTPAVRMRAAKELLIRGFGSTIPGVRRILSGKTEDLDSYLSKIVREYTNYGADSIRFLVETMENKDPEAESRGAASFIKLMRMRPRTKPAEGFTASHRVWAACELLRRAYDIKTDHITHADIQAYWSAHTPADARKDDPGSPAASLKGFTPEYLETQAAKMRDDADSAAAEQIDAHAKQKRDAAAEKIDAYAAEKPAGNPGRAARRREQRAARKAQKRAAGEQPAAAAKKPGVGEQLAATAENIAGSEKSADEQRAAGKTLKRIPRFPNRRRTREDVAEMLAFKAELESRRVDDLEPPRRRKAKKRKAAAAENIAVSEKSDDEQRDAANAKNIAAEQPAADKQRDDKNPADATTLSANPANPGRAARRREQRAARKAKKRKASAANNNGSANRKNGKAQDNHAGANGKTPVANPGPQAIHVTDVDKNTVVFSHEPLSIEEWKRLRKTLSHPDNIPANARSP